MIERRIVGISGQAGCGKDTAADRLISKFNFTRVALADPIKRYGLTVFHFTEDQLWGPSELRNKMDSRFQYCEDEDGDDAWMAVFHRAQTYNKKFVKELFPESPILQSQAFSTLEKWLLKLSKDYQRLSPRIMLQSLGTEWGRNVKADVWVRHAIRTSEALLGAGYLYDRTAGLVESPEATPPAGVVISDVRFSNELDDIKQSNGFLIRVHRPAFDEHATELGIKNHASEVEQQSFSDEQFNYIIQNKGTLEEFLDAVDVAGFILTGWEK